MKLLLDQNLSRKLVPLLAATYPEMLHLTSVMPETADDREIWSYAKDNGYVIVTKDDDFERRSILDGHPPKVIWLRLGNCTTGQVATLLQTSYKVIDAFVQDDEKSILTVP